LIEEFVSFGRHRYAAISHKPLKRKA
jgi:hypothetical protein